MNDDNFIATRINLICVYFSSQIKYKFISIVQGEKWLDLTDYYGPVEVSNLTATGKEKGLIAQRRIEKGTLLIAEKAFAMIYDKRSLWPNSFP